MDCAPGEVGAVNLLFCSLGKPFCFSIKKKKKKERGEKGGVDIHLFFFLFFSLKKIVVISFYCFTFRYAIMDFKVCHHGLSRMPSWTSSYAIMV